MPPSSPPQMSGNVVVVVGSSDSAVVAFMQRHRRHIIALALSAILLTITVKSHYPTLKSHLLASMEWINEHKAIGSLLYTILFGILTCLFVPASFVTLAAGFIFKVPLAIVVVLVGSQVGLLISVALGRSVLGPWVERMVREDKTLTAVDRAISREGWKIVLLMRLSPVVPFGVGNYILSVTSIRLPNLMFSTFLGNLPGAIVYSILGSLLTSLNETDSFEVDRRTKLLAALYSLAILASSVVFITVLAKRALRSAMAEGDGSPPVDVDAARRDGGGGDGESERFLDSSSAGDSSIARRDSVVLVRDDGDGAVSDERGRRRGNRATEGGVDGGEGRTALLTDVDGDGDGGGASNRSFVVDDHTDVDSYTEDEKRMMYITFWGAGGAVIVGTPLILLFA